MRRSILALSVLAFLALCTGAHASYDPLGSGQAKLLLDKRFVSFLGRAGVRLSATQGAKRNGKTYLLPVTAGQIDPTEGRGEADTEGSLLFENGRKEVPLRRIAVKASREPLLAKVGGSQLKLAAAKKTSSVRSGFGTKLTSTRLTLTTKLITRLNKKLRPKVPFVSNQPLGTLITDAQPQLVTIKEKGTATVTLDASFLAKLDSRFVSLNPIAPAQRFGAQASFPISAGGAIAPDGSEGTLRTAGDLEFLQLGAGQVFWHELWLDLGAGSDTAEVDVEPTPSFPGKIGRVAVLDYPPTPVSSDSRARTISVTGAPLALSPGAAAILNEAFGQGEAAVFAAGEAVGVVGFVAQAQ